MNSLPSPPETVILGSSATEPPVASTALDSGAKSLAPETEKEIIEAHAATMTGRARGRAEAKLAARESARLRVELEAERAACAVQRASAEYARREANCLRLCLESLLDHTTQPCFALDRNGLVTRWNEPLARFCGISPADAIGKPLEGVVASELTEQLDVLLQPGSESYAAVELCEAQRLSGPLAVTENARAAQLSLLPLHRIPDITETIIVLLEPLN